MHVTVCSAGAQVNREMKRLKEQKIMDTQADHRLNMTLNPWDKDFYIASAKVLPCCASGTRACKSTCAAVVLSAHLVGEGYACKAAV